MILYDLYSRPGLWVLPFLLLQEREQHQNISHTRMPSWDEHCDFMKGRPHLHWYYFDSVGFNPAGCVYLSRQREIGVGVLKAYRRQGLARQAVAEIMKLHPGRFLANINPDNQPSIDLFRSLGFGGPIQITLEHPHA